VTMSQPRPFGMVDLVILLLFAVGAISAAVWEDHQFVRHQIDRRSQLDQAAVARRPGWVWSMEYPLRRASGDLRVLLVVATVGSGTAALRRPGLLRGKSWPASGWVAGAVGAIAVAYCLVLVVVLLKSNAQWVNVSTFFLIAGPAAQGSILGAWALLAVSRRWGTRPDDWDDRLGRLVGWCWLGLYGYGIVYPAIWT
jgi:hypothetical protein